MNTIDAKGVIVGTISRAEGWLSDSRMKANGWFVGGLKASAQPTMQTNLRKEQPYLDVVPEEPMWVTVEISQIYEVRSNTDWFVR